MVQKLKITKTYRIFIMMIGLIQATMQKQVIKDNNMNSNNDLVDGEKSFEEVDFLQLNNEAKFDFGDPMINKLIYENNLAKDPEKIIDDKIEEFLRNLEKLEAEKKKNKKLDLKNLLKEYFLPPKVSSSQMCSASLQPLMKLCNYY
jgi:hypothetical protein